MFRHLANSLGFYDTTPMKKTLIIVDVQYDFLEGGALPVAGADAAYVSAVERIRPFFHQEILTADNHPQEHVSFGTFPPHCIAGTLGAELAIEPGQTILLKGESPDADEFSAFSGGKNCSKIIGDEVYVIGLAGDYCVKQTLSDLLEFLPGKKLFAVTDLIKSVDGSEYGKIDYFSGKVHFTTSSDLF